jgi:hypothetical protein
MDDAAWDLKSGPLAHGGTNMSLRLTNGPNSQPDASKRKNKTKKKDTPLTPAGDLVARRKRDYGMEYGDGL